MWISRVDNYFIVQVLESKRMIELFQNITYINLFTTEFFFHPMALVGSYVQLFCLFNHFKML